MKTHNIPSCCRKSKRSLNMLPDLALLSTLICSNYPCLELIFLVPKVFEPLKFDCISLICKLVGKLGISAGVGYKNSDSSYGQKNLQLKERLVLVTVDGLLLKKDQTFFEKY